MRPRATHGVVRVAEQYAYVGAHKLSRGDIVLVCLPTANRDPRHIERPNELDLSREPGRHLAFGHGAHRCLGLYLAPVIVQVTLRRTFERLPGLRLAVPADEVPTFESMSSYGVAVLPVTWDVPGRP